MGYREDGNALVAGTHLAEVAELVAPDGDAGDGVEGVDGGLVPDVEAADGDGRALGVGRRELDVPVLVDREAPLLHGGGDGHDARAPEHAPPQHLVPAAPGDVDRLELPVRPDVQDVSYLLIGEHLKIKI